VIRFKGDEKVDFHVFMSSKIITKDAKVAKPLNRRAVSAFYDF
jgi:hypothetical protein